MKTLITSAIIAVSATSAFAANNCGFDANDNLSYATSQIANLVYEGATPSHVGYCASALAQITADKAVAPVAAELADLTASIPSIKQAQADATYAAVQGQIEVATAQAFDAGMGEGYNNGVAYITASKVNPLTADLASATNEIAALNDFIDVMNQGVDNLVSIEVAKVKQQLNKTINAQSTTIDNQTSTINGLVLHVENITTAKDYWANEALTSATTIEALEADVADAEYKAKAAQTALAAASNKINNAKKAVQSVKGGFAVKMAVKPIWNALK